MKAIIIPRFGPADVLELADVPAPRLGATDVRIRVTGAGVNGADISQRRGLYPPPADAPEWPGLEASGVVTDVGSAVTGIAAGDAVCALLPGGGYAEQVVVDAGLVLPVPAGVPVLDAAALPEVAATVWSNVFMLGDLKPGETLLVHGGTSGIGTLAVQVALALGSRVIATAGSAEKVEFLERLGATGVNYRTEHFVDAVLGATDGRGADVILDIVGGDYLARNIASLAVDGRIMCIADRSGGESSFRLGALMQKRGRIWATTIRARPIGERRTIVAAVREHVWPLIESGRVTPVIDSVFDLADASAAHARMESSAHIGKIVLRVG
ncbi:MAG: NADPH:quinone oxidoreductase [Microbacteriaceae bacterium]|jgi:putative PIG3 family NAD(P)H quinone oxidoreductase|nr:NADPH:quinone oxidoreductase [Microbacteriaceae bacterium]